MLAGRIRMKKAIKIHPVMSQVPGNIRPMANAISKMPVAMTISVLKERKLGIMDAIPLVKAK